MGKYDRIKVYNGSAWVKPTELRVYNDSAWVSYGQDDYTDQSYSEAVLAIIRRPLYVYNDGVQTELTKHWVDTEVSTTAYTTGTFTLSSKKGYFCYCPNSSTSSNNGAFKFSGTICKTASGDKQLFYTGTSGGYLKITWLDSGKINVTIYSQYAASGYQNVSLTSSNAVGLNTPVSLNVYQSKGSATLHIVFNGTDTTKSAYASWLIASATHTVGSSSGVEFRGNLVVSGVYYTGSASAVSVTKNCTTTTKTTSHTWE